MKLENWRQFKVRSDLVISTQSHQGVLYYVVKDPITLRYFRLRPTEYAIFKMLDGETSLEDLKARLTLLGRDISDEELRMFLQQLGGANFFENLLPNQSDSLYRMALLRRKRKSLPAQLKRILFIKIPLYDPDRFFARVMPHIRFLYSRWALYTYAALLAFAVYAFLSNFAEARRNFTGLLDTRGLLIFWVIFILIKTAHELGHGFTCKYFGGEVHELGVLVLVLTPCLYCNITDAWIMDKHSRKFYISSAGIIIELIIASLAAVVWWATTPGVINSIAFRTMILAGITSILFNSNPLMKFDGYYILSDVLGMPNLRSTSVRYVSLFFRRYILGLPTPISDWLSRENLVKLFYGIASSAWIFYVMYRIVRGLLHRIPPLGVWILITTLYGLILVPIVRISAYLARRRGRVPRIDTGRLAIFSAIIAGSVYFLFFSQLGYSVSADCVIAPVKREVVYAPDAGLLASTPFHQGDAVRQGQVIAVLENPDLAMVLDGYLLNREMLDLNIHRAEGLHDFLARDTLRLARDDLDISIAETQHRIDELTLKAPFDGTILTPSTTSQLGRWLDKGSYILELADTSHAKVTVAVSEKDRRFVSEGATATVRLRAYPWRAFKGTVSFISRAPVDFLSSAALSSRTGGGVEARPDSRVGEIPLASTYEVDILLPNENSSLMLNMAGTARISYGSRRPFDIIYTRVRQNLRRSFGF